MTAPVGVTWRETFTGRLAFGQEDFNQAMRPGTASRSPPESPWPSATSRASSPRRPTEASATLRRCPPP